MAKAVPSKSRDYCFTTNNWTEEHVAGLKGLDYAYIVFGKEVGESGIPHLQGYVRFKTPRTIKSVIAKMSGSHIDYKKGTFEQAIDYCKKDGDFEEYGDLPKTPKEKGEKGGEAVKRKYEQAWQAAVEGRFMDIPADMRTRHFNTYKRIKAEFQPKPVDLDTLENEWRYGPTGSGKSRVPRLENPIHYSKKADTKWWDAYDGEDVVIIDDIDKYHVKLGYQLKIWLDHYPFTAEWKGGSAKIRPKKIIITSNYHPSEIWTDEKTLGPIMRRCKIIPVGVTEGPSDYEGYFNKPGYV